MPRSTLLPTHKVPITNFNALASQLRQAGAKFRSSIHKQDATIVFSELPSKALSILESGAKLYQTHEADFNVVPPIDLIESTSTQVNSAPQETAESPSNMEFSRNQEEIRQEAEQLVTETPQTEVDKTTVFVELIRENSIDELVETTTGESVEFVESTAEPVESTRQTSVDDLIEAPTPEVVQSVENAEQSVDLTGETLMDDPVETTTEESVVLVENPVELVEPIGETSMDDPTLATEQQLLELSKTQLKKLANKYGIEGRAKLAHHQLAAALANKVSINNL